ncbi:hypothetical protein SEA_GINGERBUG_3 [Microbacterium phage Gingerbug]|nr:hypothetical protein SEA_GINGERBUG_3 [Microbacterium phage Gingerbug]
MRLRLSITLDVERRKPEPVEEPHDTFESNGALVDMAPQPRYPLGFAPEE